MYQPPCPLTKAYTGYTYVSLRRGFHRKVNHFPTIVKISAQNGPRDILCDVAGAVFWM